MGLTHGATDAQLHAESDTLDAVAIRDIVEDVEAQLHTELLVKQLLVEELLLEGLELSDEDCGL